MGAPDLGPLRLCMAELEALGRGEIGLDHYVLNVPPELQPDGVWRVGWPDYQPAMDRLWNAFWAATGGTPSSEDYNAFLASKQPPPAGPEEVAALPHDLLVLNLFAIRRAERFCDGAWTGALKGGLLLAFARRLIEEA